MQQNAMFDCIIGLIHAIRADQQNLIENDGTQWGAPKYLLSQIIRAYVIPKEHYLVSQGAKETWERISHQRITDYVWQDKVKCEIPGAQIYKYSGNSKEPYDNPVLKLGEDFAYRSVFHDEHLVPVSAIIDELCSYEKPTYADIQHTLSKMRICKMLKAEDRRITVKSNRPSDYKEALLLAYLPVSIAV